MFGYKAVAKFLRDNKLIYMLRAHEVQEEGFRSHFASPGTGLVPAEGDPSADGDSTDGDYDSDCPDDEQDDSSHSEALNNEHMHLHPTVLTVFSAPNYCDRYGNKAAVLHIEAGGYYTVNLLECEAHPEPADMGDVSLMTLLAMGKTCPYMPTNFREFLRVASEMGPALTPLETTGSSSNLHSTAQQQQQQQSANGQSNGQGDAPAGGVRPQLQLPPM
eukprot:6508-Heterococcus_DN1.PRE.1